MTEYLLLELEGQRTNLSNMLQNDFYVLTKLEILEASKKLDDMIVEYMRQTKMFNKA